MAQIGCSSQNFARATSGGEPANRINRKTPSPFTKNDWYFEEMASVHVSSGGSKTCHFHSHAGPKSAKLGSFRGLTFGAPSSPGGLIVQPKS